MLKQYVIDGIVYQYEEGTQPKSAELLDKTQTAPKRAARTKVVKPKTKEDTATK